MRPLTGKTSAEAGDMTRDASAGEEGLLGRGNMEQMERKTRQLTERRQQTAGSKRDKHGGQDRRGGVLVRQNISGWTGVASEHRGKHLQPGYSETMELYLDLLSPPCRAVFLFAKALRIPFEFKSVDLVAGQQYSKEFEEISTVRKVPVLKDGSFILTESNAILKYLAQKFSGSVRDHWFPADLQQQACVNEYLSWQHMNLRAHCSRVFLLRAMYPVIMDSKVPTEMMDAALENLKQSVNLLEEKFLKNKTFILGDKISVADLVAAVDIMQPLGSGLDGLEGHPKLIAWLARVKKELGERLFDEAHDALMKSDSLPQKLLNNKEFDKLKLMFQKSVR